MVYAGLSGLKNIVDDFGEIIDYSQFSILNSFPALAVDYAKSFVHTRPSFCVARSGRPWWG